MVASAVEERDSERRRSKFHWFGSGKLGFLSRASTSSSHSSDRSTITKIVKPILHPPQQQHTDPSESFTSTVTSSDPPSPQSSSTPQDHSAAEIQPPHIEYETRKLLRKVMGLD